METKEHRPRRPASKPAGKTGAKSRPQQKAPARRPARPVQTDAPEMVFTPKREPTTRRKKPQPKSLWDRLRVNSAKRSKQRARDNAKRTNRPEVVYTQPTPFYLSRIVLMLTIVLATVLAVFLGISVFFKVKTVKVYGNNAYSAWTIREASGIEEGQNLLTFGRTRACGKIMAALPYVKNARSGINLPDTVNIYIEEYDVAYSICSDNGSWWLITSGGRVTEQITASAAANYTKVLGVKLDTPAVGMQAKALEEIVATEPADTEPTADALVQTEPRPVVASAQDQLRAALSILTSLERNDIVGEAASVDVTSLVDMELMYGHRYRVKLGSDDGKMDFKISSMKQAISQMNDYQTGVLDVSFVTWPDTVVFTPME